jgi:hypothetical protein
MHKRNVFNRTLAGVVRNLFGQIRSSSRTRTRAAVSLVAITAAISLSTAVLVLPFKIMADNDQVKTFTVDVSLGFPYFQNDVNPAEGQNVFSPGDTFIQDGSIFPGGTIPMGQTNFDPNAPGAIGQYRARGTFTTDFANFERAAAHDKSAAPDLAFATEMFSLGNDKSIILTDGTWPNAFFSAQRVVLGGTGSFGNVVGEVQEENVGENKNGFCNFRVTFKIRTVR